MVVDGAGGFEVVTVADGVLVDGAEASDCLSAAGGGVDLGVSARAGCFVLASGRGMLVGGELVSGCAFDATEWAVDGGWTAVGLTMLVGADGGAVFFAGGGAGVGTAGGGSGDWAAACSSCFGVLSPQPRVASEAMSAASDAMMAARWRR